MDSQPSRAEHIHLLKMLKLTSLEGYTFNSVLGIGGQGLVCKYMSPEKNPVAIKFIICPNEISIRRLHQEVEALQKCSAIGSSTVVSARSEVRQITKMPIYYFLMDCATGIPLLDIIKTNPLLMLLNFWS